MRSMSQHILLAPVAPEPAVIAVEVGCQCAFIGGNTPALFPVMERSAGQAVGSNAQQQGTGQTFKETGDALSSAGRVSSRRAKLHPNPAVSTTTAESVNATPAQHGDREHQPRFRHTARDGERHHEEGQGHGMSPAMNPTASPHACGGEPLRSACQDHPETDNG